MLATQSIFSPRAYTPSRSSPLTERSANACPRRYVSALMAHDAKENVPFSKRPVKQAPIARSREEVRDRRRDLFLRNVKKSRDDKNWEAKSEQIMRMDFMKEQRRWQSDKARAAPVFDETEEEEAEEEGDLPVFSSQMEPFTPCHITNPPSTNQYGPDAEAEAEAMLRREQEELDALLELMEQEDASQPQQFSHFGSDDEDYDALFSEMLDSDSSTHELPQHANDDDDDDDDAMDTT